MLVKLFDWMRLFDNTSFYILLLQETLIDIGPFMLLFGLSLTMFGAPLTMLSFTGDSVLT